MRVRGPRNNFPLVASPRYLFIAGGIGITPILPMIAAAAGGRRATGGWSTAAGSAASMAFLDELARYGDRVDGARRRTRPGLLDLDALLGTPEPDTLVYCCGPEPLLAAVEQRCARLAARRPARGAVRAQAADRAGARRGVRGRPARSELTLTVPPDRSILDVVEEAGVGVLSSCAEGTCGTCETPVLDGVPDHRDSVLTRGGAPRQRLHDDLRLPLVHRPARPGPLIGSDHAMGPPGITDRAVT